MVIPSPSNTGNRIRPQLGARRLLMTSPRQSLSSTLSKIDTTNMHEHHTSKPISTIQNHHHITLAHHNRSRSACCLSSPNHTISQISLHSPQTIEITLLQCPLHNKYTRTIQFRVDIPLHLKGVHSSSKVSPSNCNAPAGAPSDDYSSFTEVTIPNSMRNQNMPDRCLRKRASRLHGHSSTWNAAQGGREIGRSHV